MSKIELWKNIAEKWKYHYPPGRPSEDDKKLYELLSLNSLKGKNSKRVLVLGATEYFAASAASLSGF